MSDQPHDLPHLEDTIPGLRQAIANLNTIASAAGYRLSHLNFTPSSSHSPDNPHFPAVSFSSSLPSSVDMPVHLAHAHSLHTHSTLPQHQLPRRHHPHQPPPQHPAPINITRPKSPTLTAKRPSTSPLAPTSPQNPLSPHAPKRKRLSQPSEPTSPQRPTSNPMPTPPTTAYWGTVLADRPTPPPTQPAPTHPPLVGPSLRSPSPLQTVADTDQVQRHATLPSVTTSPLRGGLPSLHRTLSSRASPRPTFLRRTGNLLARMSPFQSSASSAQPPPTSVLPASAPPTASISVVPASVPSVVRVSSSGSASVSGVSQARPSRSPASPIPAEGATSTIPHAPKRGRRPSAAQTTAAGEQLFSCTFCEAKFRRKSDKNRHIRVVHEKSRPFVCAICDKTFGEKSNMLKHRASVHDDVRTFRCAYCDAVFSQRALCDSHVRTVHDKKQAKYFCEQCGLPFSRKVHLHEHYGQVHPHLLKAYREYEAAAAGAEAVEAAATAAAAASAASAQGSVRTAGGFVPTVGTSATLGPALGPTHEFVQLGRDEMATYGRASPRFSAELAGAPSTYRVGDQRGPWAPTEYGDDLVAAARTDAVPIGVSVEGQQHRMHAQPHSQPQLQPQAFPPHLRASPSPPPAALPSPAPPPHPGHHLHAQAQQSDLAAVPSSPQEQSRRSDGQQGKNLGDDR